MQARCGPSRATQASSSSNFAQLWWPEGEACTLHDAPVSPTETERRRQMTTAGLRRALFGKPRDLFDPQTYHHISLIAFLAWVGLGADGLSSSAYGPEESFRTLGEHHFLAVGMAFAIAFTVFVISY